MIDTDGNFSIFDNVTGELIVSGRCPPDQVWNQVREGQTLVQFECEQYRHYFDHGIVREYTPEQAEAKRNPPQDYFAVWSNYSMSYPDPRTLEDKKALKWEALKRDRTAREFANFTYNGTVFDGDRESQRRLSGAISIAKSMLAMGTPWSIDWITHDNQTVTLTSEDLVAIEIALAQRTSALFAQSQQVRAAVYACQILDHLDAIVWPV